MPYQKNPCAVQRFAKVMKFATWLQSLPAKLTPPPFRLMQIGSAFWQSRVLYVAAQLDVASALGDEECGVDTLAARIAAHPDALARLLRLLAAMEVFVETAPRTYRNNKLSAFLRQDHPQSVRAMILMHNSEAMSRPWYEQLENGVREGTPPFFLSHGEELYAYLDRHADFDALFSAAMASVEALTGDSFARDFEWGRFARIIDVGGSRGVKALAILKRHPHLTALVVDRPQIIAEAQCYWTAHPDVGVERLAFQASNLLEAVPAARNSRDIYLLCAVLHGFDDDNAAIAFGNLARASGSTGAPIALLEMVLPEVRAGLTEASFDMQMFMGSRGRERTLAEWQTLLVRSGLVLDEVVRLRSFGNLLVTHPNGARGGA